MAVKVLELHHHGIRVGPSAEEAKRAREFYGTVLGLDHDPGRPTIASMEGYWMDVAGDTQIHLMGVEGTWSRAAAPDQDPSRPHVALAVPDIEEARQELERLGVEHWMTRGIVGPESRQIFLRDPFGNAIELHQAGTCRCKASSRAMAASSMA